MLYSTHLVGFISLAYHCHYMSSMRNYSAVHSKQVLPHSSLHSAQVLPHWSTTRSACFMDVDCEGLKKQDTGFDFWTCFFAFHVTCHSSTTHIWQIKLNLACFALGGLFICAFYQPFFKQWITQPFFFEISRHFKGTSSKKERMGIQ